MPLTITLTDIEGIDKSVEELLSRNSIRDAEDLRVLSGSASERLKLAKKIGRPSEYIYFWAKQADLLRIGGISTEQVCMLISAGIGSVEDLIDADRSEVLFELNNICPQCGITEENITKWIVSAESIGHTLRSFGSPKDLGSGNADQGDEKYYVDLAEIITELGKGIANAQHQLDMNAIETQNKIFDDDTLSRYGMNATWYTIPEASFTLRMEYKVSKESEEHGNSDSQKRFRIIPSNATYNNLFKSERNEESTLSLRFVPVPLPEQFTERRSVPNLLGKTIEQSKAILDDLGIDSSFETESGKTSNGMGTEVTRQSISGDKLVKIGEKLTVFVTTDTGGGPSDD